jgi:hypothetical protein
VTRELKADLLRVGDFLESDLVVVIGRAVWIEISVV